MNSTNYQLELFYFSSCPFCQRVLKKIEQLGLKELKYCDTVENDQFRKKLLADTGITMVPCLYINGKPMHESLDIINWLEEHKQDLK